MVRVSIDIYVDVLVQSCLSKADEVTALEVLLMLDMESNFIHLIIWRLHI